VALAVGSLREQMDQTVSPPLTGLRMFDVITNAVKRIFGDANEREIRRVQPLVRRIADLEAAFTGLDDAQLAGKTAEFRQRLDNGAPIDDLLPEAFATVREVGRRTMGMRHYDCQMVGGIVIHQGKIAEMKTGEGKTLVATLPSYLNALSGKGVHLVTVNDYLARRDAEWMSPIYRFLGMSVGVVVSEDRSQANKRAAYQADITYGTNNEFGFDYLRDNMKFRLEDYVQRGHHFGIVDEVDSILIDEARTPLIISGPAQSNTDLYNVVDAVVPLLQRDIDFMLDEKSRNVTLTEDGISKVEGRLGVDNLYDPQNIDVLHHTMQALKAHHLFKRERDYVVMNGEIVIVDEFTGRLMHGRRWSDGLHQAVEAKEKVPVQEENQTYATITYQNLFRMYTKLAGMTGTAVTEAAEFASIYKLDTIVIPTNKPIARTDHEDVVYKGQNGKFNAVLAEILVANERGQPVLVGTTSVEKSALVSKMLEQRGIPHELLNAKNHEREAHIVAQAGRVGAVTISTNMAGRGTDIKLGGNPEEMARAEVDPEVDPEGYAEALARHIEECAAEADRVRAAGGLYIIGTERHESRRVDNQLRGRAGRQGDPGASKFFLALDDHLLKIFGSDKMSVWMERMGLQDDEAIEHRWITSSIENAQKKVEGYHFNTRKNLLEYDDVMNFQRKGVYNLRRRALEGSDIRGMVDDSLRSVINDIMDDFCHEGLNPEHWNLKGIRDNLERVFGITWPESDDALRDMARLDLEKRMHEEARTLLEAKREELGEAAFDQVARMFVLRLTDDLWKDHLLAVDRLRQSVGLRGYGQRNPLLEYKREAFHMFLMMSAMRDELLMTRLLQAKVSVEPAPAQPRPLAIPAGGGLNFPNLPTSLPGSEPESEPEAPAGPPAPGEETRVWAELHGVKRNDPCPCGSGNKYKKCCGRSEKDADV
jgi:preprotein translocase subunit SecA